MSDLFEASGSAFLPSQVKLADIPLVGTMGKAEVEIAAAIIVRVCQVLGDRWQPVTWGQVRDVLNNEASERREPLVAMISNPFFKPDVRELAKRGYATFDGHSAELTATGLEAMRRWVRQ